jgi:hypothetical protein
MGVDSLSVIWLQADKLDPQLEEKMERVTQESLRLKRESGELLVKALSIQECIKH